MEIKLGDKVRCKYTGFTGIAVGKIEFINGCVQYMIASKWDGKTGQREEVGIDKESLEVVKSKVIYKKEARNGGAMSLGITRRGY